MARTRQTRSTPDERKYRRKKQGDLFRAAVDDAANRRVELLGPELMVAQLDSIPAAERPGDWQETRDNAQRELDKALAHIEATDKLADKLGGKPPTTAEKRDRARAVKAARIQKAREHVDAWEDTRAGHERNLHRLDSLPKALRDEDHEEQVENEERSIDIIDRALSNLVKMIPEAASAPEEPGT